MTGADTETLRDVLDGWKAGLHPYTVGREGVAEYYASQPIGMTAAYEIRETRHLAEHLLLGFAHVDFGFTDRPTLTVYLTVILRGTDDDWLISHYQVTRL